MIIQATSHGTAAKEEPFAFTYSGDFTDNRVDGVGTVRLNTSGTLTVTGKAVTVTATIVGGGGGGACLGSRAAGGGGGGIQTITVALEPGTYDIVIGTGGAGAYASSSSNASTANDGGDTTAFGHTSTGGDGAYMYPSLFGTGAGGTPNGGDGSSSTSANATGGAPNGGAGTKTVANNAGGNGYVDLTFS